MKSFIIASLFVSTFSMGATNVGRTDILWPDLGDTGYVATTQGSIGDLSDNDMGRYFTGTAVADSTTTTFTHNLGVAFEDLEVRVYDGTHPALTRVLTYTVIGTVGFEKTQIDVTTPGGGGPHTFAVFVGQSVDAMSTRGDIIYRDASNEKARLQLGVDNRLLRSDGSDLSYGQIDDPAFFTDGAAAGAAARGIVTSGTQTFGGSKTYTLGIDVNQGGSTFNSNHDSTFGVSIGMSAGNSGRTLLLDGNTPTGDGPLLEFKKDTAHSWAIGINDGNGTDEFIIKNNDLNSVGAWLINHSTSEMEAKVRDDSNCGIGNLCSGNGFTHVESVAVNLDGGTLPGCGGGTFIRAGSVVTHAFRCSPVNVDTANTIASFKITLPQMGANNFGGDSQVLGTCETEQGDDGWIVTAVVGEKNALVYTNNPTDLVGRSLHCNIMYLIP